MGLEEVDLHDLVVVGQQPAQIAQPPDAAALGRAGSLFECGRGMRLREAHQPLQGPQAVHPAMSEEPFGPSGGVRPDQSAAIQPVIGAALDAAFLVGVDVRVGRGGIIIRAQRTVSFERRVVPRLAF